MICLWAIPYGLGAGAVDAALNNFVALHYAAKHMSWLHCFWGVGATISPYIMGYSLTNGYGWTAGYRGIGTLQLVLTIVLLSSLPLWRASIKGATATENPTSPLTLRETLSIKGVKYVLVTFFSYCALEHTAGLWASSYLVESRGITPFIAAKFASLFYLGITVGRFFNGFIADRVGDRRLIRYGIVITILGVLLIIVPGFNGYTVLFGLVVVGLGCAPIYPSIIHQTPEYFGAEYSQRIIGIQMASAYVGSTFMPPLFGFFAAKFSIGLYPFYLLLFGVLMIVTSERLTRTIPLKGGGE